MATIQPLALACVVEGLVDEAVVRRVVETVGLAVGPIYGRRGKRFLLQHLDGYNQAARFGPWLVLVDLDVEHQCAPPALKAWLPRPAEGMHLRVAVRAVESWLMADAERLSAFLGVGRHLVPRDPEGVLDPKQTLIHLAGQSRRREVREDMIPRPGSGRPEGELYVSRTIEFVTRYWRPRVAAETADSLRRCLSKLEGLAASVQTSRR